MHGGTREGAGRKLAEDKKQAISVYINSEEKEIIEDLPLPNCTSFSSRIRKLIKLGVDSIKLEIQDNKDQITYVDLFSGLGGIRIGFEQALTEKGLSGKCVFSSDIKETAIQAYKDNFGEDSKCDITKINPSNLPNFDFLLAGFPCQAFSQAGLGLGFQDTRGTLFFDVAKILLEKKPIGFVLENVEGLVNHDKGKTFKVIKNTLEELGYDIDAKVLNGKDFGLAQSRNRIYIIGIKTGRIKKLDGFQKNYSVLRDIIDDEVEAKDTGFTNKLLSHYDIEELYGKAIKDKRGGDNNIHSWDIELKGTVTPDQKDLLEKLLRQRRNKKWAELIGIDWMDGMPLTANMIKSFYPHDNLQYMLDDLVEKGYLVYEYPKKKVGNKRVKDETLEKGYNIVTGKLSFEFSKILNPNEVAPTLVATDVHKLGVPVRNGIRSLTVKECLQLFGFPENYSLDNIKTSDALDLLGNTVCVPVIKAVSNKLIESYMEALETDQIKKNVKVAY